jgi:lipooligosaccharide transport system ATP-binding protein
MRSTQPGKMDGMTRASAVIARGLTKRFGPLGAVKEIDFSVAPQTCFGFLGPNGAGKTTTMRMISCTVPPSAGSLDVLGLSVTQAPRKIKARLGLVPQEDNLDEEISVLDNLMIHARYHGMKRSRALANADQLLEFMSLTEKRNREIRELSGGMKRRLMIARAMLHEPELLILDEPTTGLDPQARHLVWEKLRELKRSGVTLLLTTHYMEEASQLCDELVIMHEGRILVQGSPRDVIVQHTTREVVEVFEPPPEIQADLDGIGLLTERVEKLADRWLLYTNDGEPLLGKVRALGIDAGCVWLRGGTLEDVFLALTGRGLLE